MDKKNDTNNVAPWHTGVIEAAATGFGVGATAAVGAGLATIGAAKINPWLGLAVLGGSTVATLGSGVATVTGKLLEEREKYHQAHSSITTDSAQHQGMVSATQQIEATR